LTLGDRVCVWVTRAPGTGCGRAKTKKDGEARREAVLREERRVWKKGRG
jgi:hypothetical protein